MPSRYEVDQYINRIRNASTSERRSCGYQAASAIYDAFRRQTDGKDASNLLYTVAAYFLFQSGEDSLSDAAYDFLRGAYGVGTSKETFINSLNNHWGEADYNHMMSLLRNFKNDEIDAIIDLASCIYCCDGDITSGERAVIYGLFGINA